MKKLFSLGIFVLVALVSFTSKAEINFDLSTVGGTLVMDYDAVSAERNKAQADRWITVVNFGAASTTAGKCGTAAKTFDIKSGRTIDFFLAKCDKLVITANIASGRGLVVTIDDGAAINLAGTGVCVDYEVLVNKEVPVKIRVNGKDSNSSWTSFFTFYYEAKSPRIDAFKINGLDAVINQDAKTITKEMPFGTNITSVTPVVTIGGTATGYSPQGAQNFSAGPVVYTATDGTVNVDYTANITVKATPDTEKAITALTINGKAATINEQTGAISCDFASFQGPLASWPVVFTLNSITASASFTSGNSHNFAAQGSLVITVTAQDNSTKVYTVTPTVSTKKNLALLSVNGKAESYDNLLMSAFDNYYVHHLLAAATAPADINAFYSNYDVIVLHANVSGTNPTALATEAIVGVKPVLNLKVFFYNSTGTPVRWAWSTTAPANAAAGTTSVDVEPKYQDHPIFNNVTFSGTTLTYYEGLPASNGNSVQYAVDLSLLDKGTSFTIATVGGTGIQMHEIQDNTAAKYLLVGLSMENNNYTYFNSNTINILKNSASYLLDPVSKYNYLTSDVATPINSRIYFSQGVIHNPAQEMVSVYSISGACMFASNAATIATDKLAQGVYVLRTENNQVLKFVK
jgi:hypothetical protein